MSTFRRLRTRLHQDRISVLMKSSRTQATKLIVSCVWVVKTMDWYIVQTLLRLRENVNWEIEEERINLLRKLDEYIIEWKYSLPDVGYIFRLEELELLLSDSSCRRDGVNFIEFVARSGYTDRPKLDEDGKPLLRRTTPLHRMPTCDREKKVRQLFKIYNKFDFNYADDHGLTHFHIACILRFEDIVTEFLEAGQDPNCIYQETGDSPLHLILKKDCSDDVVELLLRKGANPNLANADGLTPLHIICKNYSEKIDLVDMLFELSNEKYHPLQVDALDKLSNTPLHLAAYQCRRNLIELLLRKGADPNLVDAKGQTSLHIICERNDYDEDLVEILFQLSKELNRPLQLDVQDELGNTPLHLALQFFSRARVNVQKMTVKLLLRKGASPNCPNKDGSYPLHCICRRYDDDGLVEIFFRVCDEKHQLVDTDVRENVSGMTPLHWAVQGGHKNVTRYLLRRGADPNLSNAEGSTPLHVICDQWFDTGFAKLFFDISDETKRILQINAVDNEGRTPLKLAVGNFLLDVVVLLLDRGADPSGIIFPPASYFDKEHLMKWRSTDKLELVSGVLAIAERLGKSGCELERIDAELIMKYFAKFGVNSRQEHFEEVWHQDEMFTSKAKEIMVKPNLSLYDLLQLQPAEAAKLLTYMDDFEFARSKKLCQLPGRIRDCTAFLCEKVSRRFFEFWSMDPFMQLTHYRLPLLCCDMIFEHLTNKDLYNICSAASGQSSSSC
ncbi:unnamed protein product [Trichogramma brassicae]|uniref:Uncharacterized protein n=1 Tax=Trichogramma brassicae TaxID=86971 RepID=A0A6H5I9G6_9HYME|nr:unnamed protein product [Trichogramma brassicae]